MKIGDIVGFVFGIPGPDITYIRLIEVGDQVVTGWDLFFKMEVTVPLGKVWLASNSELKSIKSMLS